MSENNLFRVVDSSCTPECPKRVHHINVCGVLTEVVFELGVEKLLPFEQALKFSKISGFKVEEIDGDSLILPVAVKDSIRDQLAADEVVAKLGELTTQSLKIRAGQKPGGEIYLAAEEEDRDDIIAFILGVAPVGDGPVTSPFSDDTGNVLLKETEEDSFEEIDVSIPAVTAETESVDGAEDLTEDEELSA